MRCWHAAVILLGLALAGCGGPRKAETEPVEVTLFTWTRPAEFAANQDLCTQFEAAHPDIRVEIINEPGDRAMEKLQQMVAAGNPPDVMSIHGAYFIPMAANGSLLDLDPLLAKDTSFDLDDFYPELVELCRHEGELYSLPRYTSVYVLFYNKDLFDAAGVAYPDDTWTWDDYLAAARKLTVSGADPEKRRFGTVIDFWGARVYPWMWAAGGEILDREASRCLIDSPESQEALQFLVDLRHKWKACPPTTMADRRQNIAMFVNGQVAMFQTGAWDIQQMKEAKALRWDIAPLPKKKQHATLLGMENYAIAAGSKHPQEAWQLFTFLLGKEAQERMGRDMEKQPSRQSVANGPYLAQDVGYDRTVFVDALSYAKQAPNVPEWDRVSHFIQEQLDLMWIGKVSVADGSRRAAQQVTEALQEER
ncbi:MAG TPA: sugar ABC transporter substrate-binding protein [Armatimonadota bacterium]|nr:sugar ABC transporter substrate-binding protein [Armatimonadota bacterium]